MSSFISAKLEKSLIDLYIRIGEEITKNLGLLLGKKVTLTKKQIQSLALDQLSDVFDFPSACSTFQINQKDEIQGYLIFRKKDAILMSGLLAMYGESVLNEKMTSLDFGEAEQDAFQEICNQLIGFASRAGSEFLHTKLHIKQQKIAVLDNEQVLNSSFENLFSQEYVVNFPYVIDLDKKYNIHFNYLFPGNFISQFEERNESPKKKSDKMNETEVQEILVSTSSTEVLFINVEDSDSKLEQLFSENNISYDSIASFSQLTKQLTDNQIKLIVIRTNGHVKKGISLCRKLARSLCNQGINIWIQGSAWDQKLIREAVLSGASYLIVNPVNPELIGKRLKQVFPES